MNTTGLPELWHDALAFLSHQGTFAQIMIVTLAALFVVMALEGFRSSMRSIWQGHRTPDASPLPGTSVRLAAPAPGGARTRSFSAKPLRSARPKAPELPPRQFRSPRPTIRRTSSPMLLGAEDRLPEMPSDEVVEIAPPVQQLG